MITHTKKITTSLLAMVGAALIAAGAQAQLTYTDGDLFFGFRDTISQKGYLVDLGAYTQFTDPLTFSALSFGGSSTIGADLVQQFGASWYTTSTLKWGIFANSDGDGVFLGSKLVGTATWLTPNDASAALTAGGINTVATGFLAGGTTTASTNSADAGFQTSTAGGTYWYGVNQSPNFSSASPFNGAGIEAAVTNNLSLYQLAGSTPTALLGALKINSAGTISAVAAVPEPSTYVLFGIGGLLLLVAYRRRRQSKEELI